ASATGELSSWDTSTWARSSLPADAPLARHFADALFVLPDGKVVPEPSADSDAPARRAWKVAGDASSRTLTLRTDPGVRLALDRSARALAVGDADGAVRVRDARTGAEIAVLRASGPIACLALSPDARTLATATGAETTLWDVASGAKLRTLP